MIIERVFEIFLELLQVLNPLHLPSLPDNVVGYIETAFDYIEAGGGILANYIPLEYALTLLSILVIADAVIFAYHLVMWILKKIPILNIK